MDLDDQYVQLQVGPGTTITFVRSAVARILSSATPEETSPEAEGSGPPEETGTVVPPTVVPPTVAGDPGSPSASWTRPDPTADNGTGAGAAEEPEDGPLAS